MFYQRRGNSVLLPYSLFPSTDFVVTGCRGVGGLLFGREFTTSFDIKDFYWWSYINKTNYERKMLYYVRGG